MKKHLAFLFLCLALTLWSGCQTFNGTKFAPLQARLQPLPDGNGQTIVLVNSSGQALTNVHFRTYVWIKSQLMADQGEPYVLTSNSGLPQQGPPQNYVFKASADKMAPGQFIHFRGRYTIGDFRIVQPITKVQIVGNCDAGAFRETWVMSDNGQLQLVGVPED